MVFNSLEQELTPFPRMSTNCVLPGPITGASLNGSAISCEEDAWQFSIVPAPNAINLKQNNIPNAPDLYQSFTINLWHTHDPLNIPFPPPPSAWPRSLIGMKEENDNS
jgi:hypothetical protein